MKKLVFAAIAALVMVSVSNVFASNKMASVSWQLQLTQSLQPTQLQLQLRMKLLQQRMLLRILQQLHQLNLQTQQLLQNNITFKKQ